MQLWNVGDKSEAICPTCKRRAKTSFEIRDVPVTERDMVVPNVLVAVCDGCGEIAAIPAQSAPLLMEALEKEPAKVIARINRRLEDAVRLISSHYGTRERDFRSLLVRYYLLEMTRNQGLAKRVARLARSDVVKGKKTGRLEIRLPELALEAARVVAKEAGLRNQTSMIEGVLAAATEDVFDHRAPKRAAHLQELAALA